MPKSADLCSFSWKKCCPMQKPPLCSLSGINAQESVDSKNSQKSIDFQIFFRPCFSKYLVPSGAKYREKGLAVTKTGEGRSTDPFWNFQLLAQTWILVTLCQKRLILVISWLEKLNFQAVWAKKRQNSIDFFYYFSSFFLRYLAPSGAKYREKGLAVTSTGEGRSTDTFWDF